MALLNSKKYEGMSNYGVDAATSRPQTFKKVFITGEPRTGQKVGMMQSMHNFDEGTYIIQNTETINFIPLFFKKIREGYDDKTKKNPKLTYFCWNPTQTDSFPPEAKQAYIVAGAAFNADMKPIPRIDEPTKTALIYFKCDGSKFGGAMDYLNKINVETAKLPPLSDDPLFEKTQISWRRFIIQATIGTAKTDFGNKYVFIFTPFKQISDDKVASFLDQSDSLRKPFDDQFDSTNFIVGAKRQTPPSNQKQKTAPVETKSTQEEQKAVTEELTDIELGI